MSGIGFSAAIPVTETGRAVILLVPPIAPHLPWLEAKRGMEKEGWVRSVKRGCSVGDVQ